MRLSLGPLLVLAAAAILIAALHDVALVAARAVGPWVAWMFP
jgi:hypothetical protein